MDIEYKLGLDYIQVIQIVGGALKFEEMMARYICTSDPSEFKTHLLHADELMNKFCSAASVRELIALKNNFWKESQ